MVRGVLRGEGALFRWRVSGGEYCREQEAVVWVRRSAWERVTEREEFVGRFRVASRLPQYLDLRLVAGMLGNRRGVLDYCDVDRGSGARAVNLLVDHCEGGGRVEVDS
jgi:hypothetical protein